MGGGAEDEAGWGMAGRWAVQERFLPRQAAGESP